MTLGTAFVAQSGIAMLTVIIWTSVLTKPFILFSWHPLAQSAGILLLIQSILVLQPTHSAEQKRVGQTVHAYLNFTSFLVLAGGVGVIEYNKISSNGPHFKSVHGYLGATAACVLLLQYFVGFTMWATPALYGGQARARSMWKYHRFSGYATLILLLATVCTAADTGYVQYVLKVGLWTLAVPSGLILVGVLPRVHLYKFGFKK